MNFKEICESVLEESDGRAVQLASLSLGRDTAGDLYVTNPTHRNVIRWVQEEYQRIQLLSGNWEFHHKRGGFLNVAANRDEYNKRGVRRLAYESLYYIPSGGSARIPVFQQPYSWWQQQERVNTVSSSQPLNLIEGPVDEWIIWPIPTNAGVVYGEWWLKPQSLENADDEPCWDSYYHSLIKWNVLKLYAAEFAGEGSEAKLMARVNTMQPGLWAAFQRDYLINFEPPRPHL